LVTASANEYEDLFWGLRGGSGNFGVVTTFEFALHPVGPILLGGMLLHSHACAQVVLSAFREFMADAPDEVLAGAALVTAPPEPFVPEELRGKPALGIIACYVGEITDGERALAPLREFGPPAADLVQPLPYTALQQLIDQSLSSGMYNHWGGDFLADLPDDAIDVLCSEAAQAPSPLTQVLVLPGGGQIARGLHHRPRLVELPRRGGEDRVRTAVGDRKYERLQAIKDRYDPDNLFHLNQNIQPRRGAAAAAR
jgi:FAD/FMN-containing dehydrogenase